jgi:pyruvate formate lyase activating enzyme
MSVRPLDGGICGGSSFYDFLLYLYRFRLLGMGQLYDITPFTLLDYPGETACVAWFAGCNLRCVYCHNPDIVNGKGDKEIEELLTFLEKRKGLLSGVVFSGGEATYFAGLGTLMRQTKDMGYKVKLDTNGGRPDVLKSLLADGLLDYVALDYKCLPERAEELLGTGQFMDRFQESLVMLIEAAAKGLKLEIRTTFHPDLISEDELGRMIAELDRLGYKGTYYIQNIISYGEDTLGDVPKPSRAIDAGALPEPRHFKLAFRNFPEEQAAEEGR